MKKFITFVVALFVLVSVFPVFNLNAGQSVETLNLPVSVGKFAVKSPNSHSIPIHFELNPNELISFQGKLFYEGLGLTQDFGYPQIPLFSKRIHLENKDPISVSIKSADWEIMEMPKLDKYYPKTWGEMDIDFPDVTWEGTYPNKLGDYKFESGDDGYWLSLAVAPISLNFERGEMIVFTNIDLLINYNPDYTLTSINEDEENNKAVILCPDMLRSAAESLAVIQRADGYEVEVVTVSSIDSRFSPQENEPEDIEGYEDMSKSQKKFLKNYDYDLAKKIRSYFESKIDDINYVTLMGDGELIPPSFYNYSGWSGYEFDSYVPTDLFYSSPDLDTVPNFALGRLPVRNIEEADIVVEKIKNYREALKEDGWFHKINLGGGDPFNGGFEGEIDCQALIDMGMLDGFEVNKYYKTRKKFASKDILEALNEDAGFMYSVSHGSGEAIITEPGEVTTEDILKLPKRSKLPIFISPACINGMYDSTVVNHKLNEYKEGNGLSFSQACITSPGGPIAYFGGSRLNYAGVNWAIEGGIVKTLPFDQMDRFMQEIMNSYHNWAGTLGEMTVQAYKKYIGIGSFSMFGSSDKTLLAFVFFGDPTIKLPPTPGGSPHRIPDVELVDAPMRDLSYGAVKIPTLSIIDENTMKIKSDIPWVNFEILNLETDVKIVSDWQKVEPNSDRLFDIKINPDDKSFWQARLELPNLSEVWIYYMSAADHDLSVESGRNFFITEPKKREHFYFYILNDGLKTEENITVDFFIGSRKIKSRKIAEIESGMYESVYFKADDIGIGEHEIRVETSFDEKDQYPDDNKFERKLVVTEEETCKSVCLISYFYPSFLAEDYLEIDKYNEIASDFEGKPTEIAMIGSNSYWALVFGYPMPDLKDIGADSVIIADINAINPFAAGNLDKLNRFNSDGGSIICLGSLYNSTSAPLFNQMYEWFGINKDIKTKVEESESTQIEPLSEDSIFFEGIDKTTLQIKSNTSNKLMGTTWEDALEDEKTIIHTKTTDGYGALLTNRQNIYLSSSINAESDEDIRFLYNLISYNVRPRADAMISLSGIECKPALPTIEEEIEIIVTVDNIGNTVLKDVKVAIPELGLETTIDSLPKGESESVSFKAKAPEKTGIFTFTPEVTVDGDIDNDNNSTSLRIRVNDKKMNAEKSTISDINISDGDVYPNELKLIKGKAVPGSFINVSGSTCRADDKGNFVIAYTPTGLETGLSVKTRTPDGKTEDFKIWVAFENTKNIGYQIDEKFFVSSTNYVIKTDAPVFIMEDEAGYINLTETVEYFGLELDEKSESFVLSGEKVSFEIKKNEPVATVSIGEWNKELTTTITPKTKNDILYIPLETLDKMSFGIDLDDETLSILLDFPKGTSQTDSVSLNYINTNIENRRLTIPSEANYGKAKLVSFGALNGEVYVLKEFNITSKKMYLWTYRGIQEWSLDGEYLNTKGFPKSLSEDLDLSWSSIFHPPSSSYSGYSMRFFITSAGGTMFITDEHMAIYDRDWNKVDVIEFDDEMDIRSARCDNDGNLYIFDYYNNCHIFTDKGEKITDFEFINSDDERIENIDTHSVTPDGNIVIVKSNSTFDFFSFDSAINWSIYLFDTSGNIISEKTFDETASDDESDNETTLPNKPDFIIPDRDGSLWLVEAGWSNTIVRHWDSDFEEIDSQILETNFRRASDVKLAENGVFYISGMFKNENDSNSKNFHIMTMTPELEESFMVPYASTNSKERFYNPSYLTYDNDGNLITLAGVDIRKYDKMGTHIDDLHFRDKSGEKVLSTWFTYDNDKIYGIVNNWTDSNVFISNTDFEVQTKIPIVVEATEERDEFMLSPGNIAADSKNSEIILMDRYETNVIQVIPDYSDTDEIPEKIEVLRSYVPRGLGKGKVSSPKYLRKFEDKLFILDGNSKKIVTYNTRGEFLFEFGGEGETAGKMMSPQSMNIDKKGRIWITDAKLSKILVFDVNGTYITSLGSEGNLVPPGTISEYSSDPFKLLHPVEACANDAQITIFDYCHNRLIMLNSLQDATNMTVIPENSKLCYHTTQMSAIGSINIINSGPGTLEVEISCEDENLTIEPKKFKGNFKTLNLKYNLENTAEIPEFIFLKIESNIGISMVKIPLVQKKIDFTLKEGSNVASGAKGAVRLSNAVHKSGDTHLVSSKDLVQLIPLSGTKSSGGQTLFYNIHGRGLGFTVGNDVAELRLGEDVFKIHLGIKIEKKKDGSFMLPLDLVASFIGCEIIEQEDVLKVVSRN